MNEWAFLSGCMRERERERKPSFTAHFSLYSTLFTINTIFFTKKGVKCFTLSVSYSKVLGLPLPLSYTGLPLKIQPTRDWIQEQLPYLWQCYW